MKTFLMLVMLLFPLVGGTIETMLVYDVITKDGKLRNYRNVQDCLHKAEEFNYIDLHGFTELKISGSAQFSSKELPYILRHATGKVFIIDLRLESHGFINGLPVVWFSYRNQNNINKSAKQIYAAETKLLAELALHKKLTIHKIKKTGAGHFESINSTDVKVKTVESEQELVKQFGIDYVRFYVLDRHRPTDDQVDAFLEFVATLSKDSWLHFHCRAGKGRTTTFMVMYDMIHNAKHVSFEDIVDRHVQLGGSVLDDIPSTKESKWTTGAAINRYKFIQAFYAYVVDPNGYNKISWSEWIKHKI